MNYIGVDNGVSGTVGVISNDIVHCIATPTLRCLNYTKKKSFLRRIDGVILRKYLEVFSADSFCMIERPMANPTRWKATMSAMRALEATQTILELLKIPYEFVDSKQWQKLLLPSGLEKQELKLASMNVAMRLFPQLDLSKFEDGDGLLIAEYCRRMKK